MKEMKEILVEHERLVAHLGTQLAVVQAISNSIIHAIKADNRVYLMGNGGSAADAQHIAAAGPFS